MESLRAYITASIVVFGGIVAGSGLADLPEDRVLASSPSVDAYAPGALPPGQNVQVNIRAVSTNATSVITHRIHAILDAVEVEGNWVAWEISEVVLHRLNEFGEIDATWSADRPTVNTIDGLWWVDHDYPMQPISEDFTVLPPIVGTAISLDPALADLLFELEGSPYMAPNQGSLFPVTGELTYALVAADNPEEPEADGNDEPVELPDDPDQPYPA